MSLIVLNCQGLHAILQLKSKYFEMISIEGTKGNGIRTFLFLVENFFLQDSLQECLIKLIKLHSLEIKPNPQLELPLGPTNGQISQIWHFWKFCHKNVWSFGHFSAFKEWQNFTTILRYNFPPDPQMTKSQFHQHFTSSFFVRMLNMTYNVRTKKLQITLLYKKAARIM